MFRIGILEMVVTCAIIALSIVIPVIVIRGYAMLNKRIQDLERKIDEKK
jgi:hypothetical protein